MKDFYDQVKASADYINGITDGQADIAVILGSGLGSLADTVTDPVVIPYSDIPNFPKSTAKGHAGNLVFGKIGHVKVMMMQGRFHYYEGYSMKEVTYPVYMMKLLGIKHMLVTNACGGINTDFEPGTLMLITDYINFVSNNPLVGENDERFGPRFPDMTEAYNKAWIGQAKGIADDLGVSYKEGVYGGFIGPCFETAAEIRAFSLLGADAIGMSTVPETIVANYLGLKVLGISCVTNMATGIQQHKHSHENVLATAQKASIDFAKWVEAIIRQLS